MLTGLTYIETNAKYEIKLEIINKKKTNTISGSIDLIQHWLSEGLIVSSIIHIMDDII